MTLREYQDDVAYALWQSGLNDVADCYTYEDYENGTTAESVALRAQRNIQPTKFVLDFDGTWREV